MDGNLEMKIKNLYKQNNFDDHKSITINTGNPLSVSFQLVFRTVAQLVGF